MQLTLYKYHIKDNIIPIIYTTFFGIAYNSSISTRYTKKKIYENKNQEVKLCVLHCPWMDRYWQIYR